MTLKNSTEFFHEVHDPFEQYFKGGSMYSFHNLCWQFIVNEIHQDKLVILHPVYHKSLLQLSMVYFGERGHQATYVEFVKGTTYDQATAIADQLNEIMFGVKPLLGDAIVMMSMRKEPAPVSQDEEDD